MKHPATGGHALGTRSAAATASTHPHPVRPTSRHTAMEGPRPAPSPAWGLPRPVLPANFHAASREPSRVRVPLPPKPRVTFPITPSRLPARTPECRSAERRRTLGAGRAALVLVAVGLRHGAALTPETELAGTKRLSPLRVP